jgi:elongation factor Ts
MMDCKSALNETKGDMESAVDYLRKKGLAAAAKKAGRVAAEGAVGSYIHGGGKLGVLIEVNCETDFVAKNEQFQQLAADIVAHAAATKPANAEELLGQTLSDGKTVQENIDGVAAVIGEKLALGRVAVLDGTVTGYMHRRASDLPPQIGVLVSFEGDDAEAARAAAMQISALRAQYLTRDDVPADVVESERRIAEATSREEGKPEAALPKIVEGRVNGFFKEVVLLEQPFVKDNKKTVGAYLDGAGVKLTGFVRFEVGTT